ncbi:MAG TPA: GNAT family N-acetyltransferase [Gemmatimonadales bacterium]|nr:GNAT family N-acetyltransferase [Gemmatimonadales bacterium]
MTDLLIRDMQQDEDFAAWFSDLLEMEEHRGTGFHLDDRYLVLSNEIGDWIGGLRFTLRGGVATLLELGVAPAARHQGHAHRLLAAFEERAVEHGSHLAEFWTDDTRSEGLLSALGWRVVTRRDDYIGHRSWALMEKPLAPAAAGG